MAPGTHAPKVSICSSQRALRVPRKKLDALIRFVARRQGAAVAEVDLAVVGSDQIASLNRRHLRRSGPTDVLSFDLSDAGAKRLCVQLVVCGDLAAARAREFGLSAQRELMLYVVHGLLHLMGHDDKTPAAAARMHARENEILDEFLKCIRPRARPG